MKIQAYAAFSAKGVLEPFSYETKPLLAEEVEVKISHCGICHSDVHLIDNDWKNSVYPLVPGHEIIGTISAVGSDVRHLQMGQRVGIGWQCGSCMNCEWCHKGEENLCGHSQGVALNHFGGFAEKVRSNAQFVIPIPAQLASENAAPLLCGGITVYSPLKYYGVQPYMKVGVIGIGGLGHLALQFARAFGCEVTAFSSDPSKEKEAKQFGAHHFVASKDDKALQAHANSLDFILSTAHATLNWDAYLMVLRPHGKLCFVGVAADNLSIPVFSLLRGKKTICGSVIGAPNEITEMLNFAARHKIQALTQTLPMAKANEGLALVRANKARYRMVLCN